MQGLTITGVAIAVVVAAIGSCRRDKPRPPEEARAPAPATAAPVGVTFAPAADAASPASVALRQIRTFGGASGQMWAVMQIVNQTDRPMVPEIRFHYRDGSGQAVSQGEGVEVCPIPALVMRPREKISFLTKVPPAAATAGYDIALDNANAEALARDTRTDLEVVGAQLASGGAPSLLGSHNQLTGFVENRTAFTLSDVTVQAVFYDAAGNIVGHGDARLKDRRIKPGTRAPFQLLAEFMLAPAASFSARAWTIGPRK
jgi:hypothetical protein